MMQAKLDETLAGELEQVAKRNQLTLADQGRTDVETAHCRDERRATAQDRNEAIEAPERPRRDLHDRQRRSQRQLADPRVDRDECRASRRVDEAQMARRRLNEAAWLVLQASIASRTSQ